MFEYRVCKQDKWYWIRWWDGTRYQGTLLYQTIEEAMDKAISQTQGQ